MKKKKNAYMYFFCLYQCLEQIINNNEKKNVCRTVFGLLPKLYCEKKNLYCKGPIALQEVYCKLERTWQCIARQFLYCNLVGLKLCCNTQDCIAIEWQLG